MGIYLFTNSDGTKVLQILECEGMGAEALEVRKEMEKKRGETVIAWAKMGGNNAALKIK